MNVGEELYAEYTRVKQEQQLMGHEALDYVYKQHNYDLAEQELLYEMVIPDVFREFGLLSQDRFKNKREAEIVRQIELSLGINHFARPLDRLNKIDDFLYALKALT